MDWAQHMAFDATRLSYFSSSHDAVPDDGTRTCSVDAGPSSYYYGGGPYDYKSGLPNDFYNALHWANKIVPLGQTLHRDYYSTKKWIKDLDLPVEKIDASKNDCMLYWKDDVDLEYSKFYGDARYKST
ncbi:UNVERIFIED_CONTAM: hypothetical protein Sindi_1426500 [Sesamum indicum]